MSTTTVNSEFLTVELTTAEHALALHGDLRIPLADVTGVELLPDGYRAAHGLRAPGMRIPGRRLIGTMWSRTGREFADVRSGEPAVRVTLRNQPWASVLVSTPQAAELAADLTTRLPGGAPRDQA
ncbi:hypothetical protein KZZ52_18820 [Dactylosporangium sp. AC04546]|uniref:hypothetical protein n=1 Tax=Dactylosporangium sp. AC04546 TaxID=2862460 RepID=UPI001EE0C72C|nr:hypothetical protein [Dactylosporangium sp. AC04546]WVK87357.1 hypothetical protein KZZ52_18820 [Dactylosporangium sp. AC04546]